MRIFFILDKQKNKIYSLLSEIDNEETIEEEDEISKNGEEVLADLDIKKLTPESEDILTPFFDLLLSINAQGDYALLLAIEELLAKCFEEGVKSSKKIK